MGKLNAIEDLWNTKKPFTADLKPEEALGVLNQLESTIFENKAKLEKLNKAKELMKLPPIDIDLMNTIIEDSSLLREVWSKVQELFSPLNEINETPF